MRPDAVPFGLLRHSLGLLCGFEASQGACLGFLGVSWEPIGAILGRPGAKLRGLGATFGALGLLMIWGSDLGSRKGAQREAFGEPKRSKNRSENEMQIEERKSHLLESSWCDLGSMFKASRGKTDIFC